MPVDPTQPPSTSKNRTLDRLKEAVRELPREEDEQDLGGTTPRGNQATDEPELRTGEDKLSRVLGH